MLNSAHELQSPPKHRTLQLTSVHSLGLEGFPAFNHTTQVVKALEPIDRIPYLYNTSTIAVQPFGDLSVGKQYNAGEGYFGVDLILRSTLDIGQQATLEYTSWLQYKDLPRPHHRRRVGRHALELLDITVQFDEDTLPDNVWWAEWASLSEDAPPIPHTMQTVELISPSDPDLSGVRQAQYSAENIAPGTILGLVWRFPE